MTSITSSTSSQRVQFIPIDPSGISDETDSVLLEGCSLKQNPQVKIDPLPALQTSGVSLQELIRRESLSTKTILFGADCKPLFSFLSNDFPSSFEFGGLRYNCATSAYESQKFLNHPDIMWRFTTLDAEQAYALSAEKHLMKHSTWYQNRLETMSHVLRAKFGQNPTLKEQLLATADTYLVLHTSKKNMDAYWTNNGDGSGGNEMGNLLMGIRQENGGHGRVAQPMEYRELALACAPQSPIPPCLDKSDADILSEIDELNRQINNDDYVRNTQIARFMPNQEFTRFRFNNFPHDKTLVPLSSKRFINASFVLNKEFIGTQSPMPHTNEDFWLMAYEHDVPVVIMLNRLGDPGDDIYFPFSLSDSKQYGSIRLKLIEEPFFKTDPTWRQNPHEEEPHAIIHRKILVMHKGKEKLVHHFQYQNWRDFSAGNERAAAYLVKVVNPIRTNLGGPTVIHCHAGVGRTSVAITLLSEALNLSSGTIDIKRNVERQRSPDEGRCNSMMQARDQYHFCYRTLREINRDLNK